MLEKAIEKAVVAYANKLGFMCKKLQTGVGGTAGWPDRLFISPTGRVIWVEFKSSTGALRPLQELLIAQLRSYKQLVYVVNDIDYGKKIFDDYAREDQQLP